MKKFALSWIIIVSVATAVSILDYEKGDRVGVWVCIVAFGVLLDAASIFREYQKHKRSVKAEWIYKLFTFGIFIVVWNLGWLIYQLGSWAVSGLLVLLVSGVIVANVCFDVYLKEYRKGYRDALLDCQKRLNEMTAEKVMSGIEKIPFKFCVSPYIWADYLGRQKCDANTSK